MLPQSIMYKRRTGRWFLFQRERFAAFLSLVEQRQVIAINPRTLSIQEAQAIYLCGFNLWPVHRKVFGSKKKKTKMELIVETSE